MPRIEQRETFGARSIENVAYPATADSTGVPDQSLRSAVRNLRNQNIPINSSPAERSALSETRLVLAAQAGSSAAFAELQGRYARRLYRTIIAITKNREDAEDALQETFLRAHLALCNFEGRSSVYSWLTRIAINSALMVLRKRRARPEFLFDPSTDEVEKDPSQLEIKDHSLNPEQVCDQRERRACILRAIQRLDPKLRIALQIRVRYGCSIKEIAETLGISEAAAKTRLHRARKCLIRMRAVRLLTANALVSPASERERVNFGLQDRGQS